MDHKLNCDIGTFSKIIDDFNTYKIDYMCYSFFKASKLSKYNILPLNPIQSKLLNSFIIDKDKLKIIGKISPNYFYISLIGIYSKKYIDGLFGFLLTSIAYQTAIKSNKNNSILAPFFISTALVLHGGEIYLSLIHI